jgi:hypothetical protein
LASRSNSKPSARSVRVWQEVDLTSTSNLKLSAPGLVSTMPIRDVASNQDSAPLTSFGGFWKLSLLLGGFSVGRKKESPARLVRA